MKERNKNGTRVISLLNGSVLWNTNVLSENKKLIYQAIIQCNLIYGAETRVLNTQQCNKLLANEMDFWRGYTEAQKFSEVIATVGVSTVKNMLDIVGENCYDTLDA